MSEGKYLLGLDLGTTRVKAVIIDKAGKIFGTGNSGYSLDRPSDDAVEQDPGDWLRESCRVIRDTIANAGIGPGEIQALGLADQMHTAVFLDEKMDTLRPAITWADNRTSAEAAEIEDRTGRDRLLRTAYNRSLPGFTAPKVLWLKKHEPENFAKLSKLVLPKDYLHYRLTGNLLAEKAGASATLLFDLKNEDWSEDLLDVVGLTGDNLPPLTEPLSVSGKITAEAGESTGLSPETPVVAGAGDQQVGALGIGAIIPGVVASTIGTGGQLFTTVRSLPEPNEGRIHVFRGLLENSWHVMGAMQTAGLALRWFKENVLDSYSGTELGYEEISEIAARAPAGSRNLLFLPYLAGGRSPHMDPNARGCFVGLNLNHELPHLLWSIMEGVTFGMKDSLDLFEEMEIPVEEIRCAGGGANSPVWRRIQADIYGRRVVKTNVEENAAFGAALLTGLGTDFFDGTLEEIAGSLIKTKEETVPDPSNREKYDELHGRFQSVYRSLEPEFVELVNSH